MFIYIIVVTVKNLIIWLPLYNYLNLKPKLFRPTLFSRFSFGDISEIIEFALLSYIFTFLFATNSCGNRHMQWRVREQFAISIPLSRYNDYVLHAPSLHAVVKVVMWSRGPLLTNPMANPIPIPHPTNLALFGHKITLYRFNQGAHTIARGSNRSRGWAPWPPPPSL